MNKQVVQETYKKVSQLQHVLLRPDTYIGSTAITEDNMWVIDDNKMVLKKIRYVPGLYKIFDEILVNAADNYQRDNKMTKIDVSISSKGMITVVNDGKGIPIQIHKEHKIYVAELIFGHLLTSSNFEDEDKKITGGRNGYGAKLANMFSSYFKVETGSSHKMLSIQWSNNMRKMKEPVIFNYQGKDYTKIEFMPDFKRFGLEGFTLQMLELFKRRVCDLAGILKVKVFFNNKEIQVRTFQDYARLYLDENISTIWDPYADNPRWKLIIAPSEGQFQQISFVNSICTSKGGTHVNYITDQIVQHLTPILKKKAKDINVKPFQIKAHFKIFLNCLIQNPAFDSQTKQQLTTNASKFGSSYQVSDKLVKQIVKSGIVDRILGSLRAKENTKIDKQLKKIKNTKLVISKLEDANLAGRSQNCILILTEGDSAKSLAMSGIEHLGRDYFGVFPLRGKLINAKELTTKQVMENSELSNIVKIMGLQFGKVYESTKDLRYGSVMIMADQDTDGSHIKGLIINFFETFWPSLCKIKDFLRQFVTPIIRCRKGQQKIDFFSEGDFKNWKISNGDEQFKTKYYKGLGTSTHSQAQQYFSNLQKHQIKFSYSDQKDVEMLNLAFLKKNADARKKWLEQYNPDINIDYSVKTLKIQNFINQQFIHFSNYDNVRSIPSIVDGLKPSQRKILYACFKRNLKNQIKVAQLAGYVSEHSAYHHGEVSLCGTIIGMAQDYIGSNNLNLLLPIGQFGTRHLAGKDAASARYIFTSLNPMSRYLFIQADDHIVDYLEEDNMTIQPKYYYPILPLVLINGCQGIGSGWSTTVHPHLVDDVIAVVKERLKKQCKVISIGWQGFSGSVQLQKPGVYSIKGKFEIDGQTVTISQIPLNKCVRDYKSFLQEKLRTIDNIDPQLEDIRQYHFGDKIQFVITFVQGKQPSEDQMQKFLRLKTTYQTGNMTLFAPNRKIKKYQTVSDIVEQFYHIRIKAYTARKQYLISRFQREAELLDSKINFIDRVVQGNFKMMESRQGWIQQLTAQKYPKFNELTKVKSTKKHQYQISEENKQYNYLLTIPIWSFCKQKIKQLKTAREEVIKLLNYYKSLSQQQMWEKDLEQFQLAWNSHKESQKVKNKMNSQSKNQLQTGSKKRSRRNRKFCSEEEEDEQESSVDKAQVQTKKKTKRAKKGQGKQKTKKNKQSQIEQVEQNMNGRKRIKQNNIEGEYKISADIDVNNQKDLIGNLISKYLKPTGSNDIMGLEQRLKVRLNEAQGQFMSSYKEAKELSGKKSQDNPVEEVELDKKDNKNNDLGVYDWLD